MLAITTIVALIVWDKAIVIASHAETNRLLRAGGTPAPPETLEGTLPYCADARVTGGVEVWVCLRAARRSHFGMRTAKRIAVQSARHWRRILEQLLIIGGVEQNPGPTKSSAPRRVEQFTVWNVNEAFEHAAVGADTSYPAQAERLLSQCRP